MRRFPLLIAGIVLVLLSLNLLAQRSGGHGGRGSSAGGAGGARGTDSPGDPELLHNLHHAMAVQAFGEQPARFQSLAKNTEIAQQQAEALKQQAAKLDSSTDYSSQTAALTRAINEAQASNDEFLKSFTSAQKTGLKDFVKKLGKADSDVTREWKALDQQLKRPNADRKRIADAAGKLAQALAKLHTEQLAIGAEMGLEQPS